MFVNELDEGVSFKSTADLLPNRLRGLEQREKKDEFYVSIKCNCSFGDLVGCLAVNEIGLEVLGEKTVLKIKYACKVIISKGYQKIMVHKVGILTLCGGGLPALRPITFSFIVRNIETLFVRSLILIFMVLQEHSIFVVRFYNRKKLGNEFNSFGEQ